MALKTADLNRHNRIICNIIEIELFTKFLILHHQIKLTKL